mgnify:CR=1 FL=1
MSPEPKIYRTHRATWLERLVKKGNWRHGVEIGVYKGITFKYLIERCPQLHLTGVDVFYDDREWLNWDKQSSEKLKETTPVPWYNDLMKFCDKFKPRAKLIRDFSNKAHVHFKNESLDFIFIDAGHRYKDVAEDIDLWEPKVKVDGFIAGHDIDVPDVKQAVVERNPFFMTSSDNIWWWMK